MTVSKVAITHLKELHKLVERTRAVEHRSRSDVTQEALRTHFGGAVYRPSEPERAELIAALEEAHIDPTSVQDWSDVQAELRARL